MAPALLTATTLASAYTAGDNVMKLTSVTAATGATSIVKGSMIRVDFECFKVTADPTGLFVPVAGGKEGTAAVSHNKLAFLQFGNPGDFAVAPVGAGSLQPPALVATKATYGVAGAITIPTAMTEQNIDLVTGTAGAMTLALPTIEQEGIELLIMARDAQAYTVTTPSAGYNGATHIATYNGVIGSSMRVRATNLSWAVLTLTGVSLS